MQKNSFSFLGFHGVIQGRHQESLPGVLVSPISDIVGQQDRTFNYHYNLGSND